MSPPSLTAPRAHPMSSPLLPKASTSTRSQKSSAREVLKRTLHDGCSQPCQDATHALFELTSKILEPMLAIAQAIHGCCVKGSRSLQEAFDVQNLQCVCRGLDIPLHAKTNSDWANWSMIRLKGALQAQKLCSAPSTLYTS